MTIGFLWLTIGIVVSAGLKLAVGISALVRRRRASAVKDLGRISGQWIATQRTHERESGGLWA